MSTLSPIQQTTKRLIEQLELKELPDTLQDDEQTIYEKLTEAVAHKLRAILDRPHQLAQLLYKVDVCEKKANHVLSTSASAEIPFTLARLLIDRQLHKMYLRQKYSEQFSPKGPPPSQDEALPLPNQDPEAPPALDSMALRSSTSSRHNKK